MLFHICGFFYSKKYKVPYTVRAVARLKFGRGICYYATYGPANRCIELKKNLSHLTSGPKFRAGGGEHLPSLTNTSYGPDCDAITLQEIVPNLN